MKNKKLLGWLLMSPLIVIAIIGLYYTGGIMSVIFAGCVILCIVGFLIVTDR